MRLLCVTAALATGLCADAVCAADLGNGAAAYGQPDRAFAQFLDSRDAAAEHRQPDRVSAPFWREVRQPGFRRSRALLRQALQQLEAGMRQLPGGWEAVCRRILTLPLSADSTLVRQGRAKALRELLPEAFRRRAYLDGARARLAKALEHAPDDPELLSVLARVLSKWEEPGPPWDCTTRRKDIEAIQVFERLRQLDPLLQASAVAFELGVLWTRQHDFARAAQEYEKALGLNLNPEQAATILTNLGEVTMLAGDVSSALSHYERALALSQDGRDHLLAVWGLAVALDRLGDHASALQQAARALSADGGSARVLYSDAVFYEPRHELLYYEALAYEALAQQNGPGGARALSAARHSWRNYLSQAGEYSLWAAHAKANLARVQKELKHLERRARPQAGSR